MENIKNFFVKYRGAVIGGVLAIIFIILRLHKVLICGMLILAGIFIGNYIQYNKENVKIKLKFYIDKL